MTIMTMSLWHLCISLRVGVILDSKIDGWSFLYSRYPLNSDDPLNSQTPSNSTNSIFNHCFHIMLGLV